VDVGEALLYANEEGQIVDACGKVIPEYSYITVLENGSLSDGECILEGYSLSRNGQIECYLVGDVELEDVGEIALLRIFPLYSHSCAVLPLTAAVSHTIRQNQTTQRHERKYRTITIPIEQGYRRPCLVPG
jgi:hypothetical protein